MITQEQFLALVAEILEVPADTVEIDADLEALGWDSLSDLGFIAAADERFGKSIDAEALAASETPANLYALLAS
jgi:acyl carrier protein